MFRTRLNELTPPSVTCQIPPASLALGRAIGLQNRTLVYGGGSSGLMGSVSQASRDVGGQTLGFVPRAIARGGGEPGCAPTLKEGRGVVEEDEGTVLVGSMHERKTRMAEAAEGGFFGLPGGYGTFEEVSC